MLASCKLGTRSLSRSNMASAWRSPSPPT